MPLVIRPGPSKFFFINLPSGLVHALINQSFVGACKNYIYVHPELFIKKKAAAAEEANQVMK
jgi:hypothetical protein